MSGRRWRIRLLLALCAGALVATTLAVVHDAAQRSLRRSLGGAVEPARVQLLADDLSRVIGAAAVLSVLAAMLAGAGLGALLVRPMSRLRAAVPRAGEQPSVLPDTRIAEVHALAVAIDRAAADRAGSLRAVTAERDVLATLVSFVSEGILQVAGDGRVLYANPAARRLLGLPGDAAGRPVATLIWHAELRALIERALVGQLPGAAEITVDDRRLLVGARAVAPDAANGSPAGGTVLAFTDLTEVRRLEGVRRDFVANVSHELKTPLTAIRGYVETLMSDDLPAAMRDRFLEVIRKNAERLQDIVDDLLDLSRLESGVWRPELRPLDPLRLAEDVWATHSADAERKGVGFATSGEAVEVLADAGALRQVLTNLYDNALRHTPPGGRIVVVARAEPGAREPRPPAGAPAQRTWILLEVRDTGSGIPHDALPRIFERFYRVDPARSRAEGGTGLGLSIVKHLMESMGGSVTAESQVGKGTTVRLRLRAP